MAKKISTLSPGNLVKLNENGVPKKYIFLEHNHYGEGEVTLLRKDVFGPSAWAPSAQNVSGIYNGSAMDMFCNTQFPRTLDPIIQMCLVNVMIPTATRSSATPIHDLSRKGFSLSAIELGLATAPAEGTVFPYLDTQANRIAYLDEASSAYSYWSRSINDVYGYTVATTGVVGVGTATMYMSAVARNSPRPAIALSSEVMVSDAVDADGCYTIESAPAAEQYQKVDGVWLRMV